MFYFVNNPQDPYTNVWFNVADVPAWEEDSRGVPLYEVSVFGSTTGVNSYDCSFWMGFYTPGQVERLSNLSDLSFLLASSSVDMGYPSGGNFRSGEGAITSIELASVPEPSTLALAFFAVSGIAAMMHRHRRGS